MSALLPPTPRALRAWLLGGLLVVLLAMRIVPCWTVLTGVDGEPRFPTNDPYFHLRQALYCNAHFPQIQRWEDVSRYPERERNDASGLYDLFLGGTAWLINGGTPSPLVVKWLCFLFPPLCMGGVLLLGYRLLRQNAGGSLALLLAGWLVFMPGDGVGRSSLGFCDHHVVEMLLSVACILAWVRLLRTEEKTPHPWWRPAWGAALPFAVFHFTWLGGPIYVLVLAVTVWIQVLAETAQGKASSTAARAAVRLLATHIILTALPGWFWPDLPLNVRFHHGMLAGAVVLIAGLPLYARLLSIAGRRFSPARAVCLGLGVTIAAGAIAYLASDQVRTFAGMLLTPKSLLVQEHRPVSLAYYFFLTGLPGLLLVAAPAVMMITEAWRRPLWLAASIPSWLIVALWMHTRDYGYQAALHAVLAAGPLRAALGTHWAGRVKIKTVAITLAGLSMVQLALAWPLRVTAPLWLDSNLLRDGLLYANDGWQEAVAWWNRQPPPETQSATATAALPRGRIGVLGDWATGDLVNTLTPWPAVNSRYPEAEGMLPLFLAGEEAVRASPVRRSTVAEAVDYVIVEPTLVGDYLERHLETVGLRPADFLAQRNVKTPDGVRALPVLNRRFRQCFAERLLTDDSQGMGHFRLVFESRQQNVLRSLFDPAGLGMIRKASPIHDPHERSRWATLFKLASWRENDRIGYDGIICPAVKIFQQVVGATVEGSAAPNTEITASLDLRVDSTGRSFRYEQTARSDATGAFRIVLPYSNERPPGGGVSPAAAWTLKVGDQPRPFTLTESTVIQGATLRLPPLSAASEAAP